MVSLNDIAKAILNGDYSVRKQYVIKGKNRRIKEYLIPLNWGAFGSTRSCNEHPEMILQYIIKNIFSFGEEQGDRYMVNAHTHFEVPENLLGDFPLVEEALKKYGYKYYTLASVQDIDYAFTSLERNNKMAQIYTGKDVDTILMGMAILSVRLDGKVHSMGFLDMDALLDDEGAQEKITNHIKMIRKEEEKTGEKYIPYIDEALPILDIIDHFTLENEYPDWIDQKSDVLFDDPNLTSIRGVEKIKSIFQSDINELQLPDKKMPGEFGAYAIATQGSEKIDTLVKPFRPRIMMPDSWKDIRRISAKSAIPIIKISADEETLEVMLRIDSGREVEVADGLYGAPQAIIPVEGHAYFVDGGIENYLPKELLREIAKLP